MNRVSSTLDIGALKRLRILCISETGWFDTATVFDDIRAAGSAQSDQYAIPWPPSGRLHAENAAGFSALLEAETTDGRLRRLLFDTGWSPEWRMQFMAACTFRLWKIGTRSGTRSCKP